jgi:hypothetical protein
VRALISDKALAQRVGAAARQEVEAFGWKAATRKIREQQYLRAIRLGKTRHRCAAAGWTAAAVAALSLLCALLAALLGLGLLLQQLGSLPAAALARCAGLALPPPAYGLGPRPPVACRMPVLPPWPPSLRRRAALHRPICQACWLLSPWLMRPAPCWCRFIWLARRVGILALWRRLVALVGALAAWLVTKMDYASPMRA